MSEFAVGQRWISDAENELGLGVITEVSARAVHIYFPAAQEKRIYAIASAPLTRVLFVKGDVIHHSEGWQGEVLEITLKSTALYLVKRQDSNEEVVVSEQELAGQISFSKPQERLFAGQIDRNDRFALRYRALQQQQAQFQSPLRGLRGIRAGLIPHQLHIANDVGRRIHPRVLLADEVGLGKTIEAGMILQCQRFSGRADRVLVIVPETLQHQWLVEMLRRFNLHFSLFDEERANDFSATEEQAETNPFESENLIICSLNWLMKHRKRGAQVLSSQFDMLIVDEAHHLAWSPENVSPEYELVEQLAAHIPSVLLLTATPEQLGQQSHFARLKLLDPNRFYDYNAFAIEQESYQPVVEAVQSLLAQRPLNQTERYSLFTLMDGYNITPLLRVLDSRYTDAEEKQEARQELINHLIDRHGTSRVLFRNTRQGVKGFPKRVYHQINLPLPPAYSDVLNALKPKEKKSVTELFYPERLFQQANPNMSWWECDPRVEWLVDFLKNHRQEKTLVICRYADTAIALENVLHRKEAIRTALFHEKMSIVERDRAAAYFAETEQGAQVLVSSSIGSEGRNFQFANHLVLFNLPDNPDLLEQCIGRLDRIGQTQDIQIYVPCFENSAQTLLADWYHQGLNAFEETCPMGATLFQECGQKLQKFLLNSTAQTDLERNNFDKFLQATIKQRLELKQILENGRDRLLELNSNGGATAQSLADAISQEDGNAELVDFTQNLFDIVGVEQEDLGEKSIVISPTGTMLVPDFPGLKEDGVTVTFDRNFALAREDVEFLTWDHPMLRNGIDLVVSGDIGKTAACLLINKHLPEGTLLLELIYVVETQSPKGLQLNRFLPPTPVRLLLDIKGNDLAPKVTTRALEKQLKPMAKSLANQIVKKVRSIIDVLLQQAESQIQAQTQQIIDQAIQQASQQLDAELTRLKTLQQVNKSIRQDEIDALEQIRSYSLAQLEKANWRLDSLRLLVVRKGED